MKIALCDDDERDRTQIRQFINTHQKNHNVIDFNSVSPFIKQLDKGDHYDMLFLDIEMPDFDGWEAAKLIKQFYPDLYIFMITILENRIRDCFDRVNWFASKPITEKIIHNTLDKAYNKLFPPILELTIDKMPVILTVPEIIYLEVKRNDVYIHTIKTVHRVRDSLFNISRQLNLPCFVYSHKSYIINLEHVNKYEDNQVILQNGEKIPLSRSRSKQFYDGLRAYVRSKKSNG